MIAPRQPRLLVHALLDDGPLAVFREDEAVQVNLKAVGDGVVVDARGQAAGADQRIAVEARRLRDRPQLVGRVARVTAAAAADVDAELVRARVQPALRGAQHRRRDAGRMPVHPHHAAERLEPERIAQPAEQRRLAVVMDDALRDGRAERRHPRRQPRRHASAMERQIGNARAFHALC